MKTLSNDWLSFHSLRSYLEGGGCFCLFVFHLDDVQLFLMSQEGYLPTVTIFAGTREVTFQM